MTRKIPVYSCEGWSSCAYNPVDTKPKLTEQIIDEQGRAAIRGTVAVVVRSIV